MNVMISPREQQSLKSTSATSPKSDMLKSLFNRWDISGDGFISYEEFHRMFQSLNAGFSAQEVDALIHEIDVDGNNLIDFNEFISYLYDGKVASQRAKLEEEEEEDPYQVEWDQLSVDHFTEQNAACSQEIAELVRKSKLSFAQAGSDAWGQDPIYQTQDFQILKQDGDEVKKRFDAIIKEILEEFKTTELSRQNSTDSQNSTQQNSATGQNSMQKVATAESSVSTKGIERGEKKCRIKFGGDTSLMSDVVRGTIVVDGKVNDLYSVVKYFVTCPQLQTRAIHFTHFDDRYQKPLGNYRDILTLIRIDGHVCELQFNLKNIVKIKNSKAGHGQYEKIRLFNDNLLLATMKNNEVAAIEQLRKGAVPNVKDGKHGLSALHFAAFHNSRMVIQHLLDLGADVYSVDNYGHMPLHRAMLKNHIEIVKMLIEKMDGDVLLAKLTKQSGPCLMHCAEIAYHKQQDAVTNFLRPVVKKALTHEVLDVRIASAFALEAMGEVSKELESLVEEVKREDAFRRDAEVAEANGLEELEPFIMAVKPTDLLLKSKEFPRTEEVGDIISNLVARHKTADLSRNEKFFESKHTGIAKMLFSKTATSTTLLSLNLSWNNLGPDRAQPLAAMLANNSSLTSLNLFANYLEDAGGALIGEALTKNTSLKTLDLGRNHLAQRSGDKLSSAMEENVALSELKWDFDDTIPPQNEEKIRLRIAANKFMDSIHRQNHSSFRMDLSGIKLNKQQMREVTQIIMYSESLETLTIAQNYHLDEEDGQMLMQATKCNGSLTKIECHHTSLGLATEYRIMRKKEAEIVAALKKEEGMNNLRMYAAEVDLSNAMLNPQDVFAVALNIETNPKIRKLDISCNEISEEWIVKAVEKSHSLEEVSMENCNLSTEAAEAIRTALERNKLRSSKS